MGVKLENGWQGTLAEVKVALGMEGTEFAREWRRLSEKDKTDLKNAVWSGTMTY